MMQEFVEKLIGRLEKINHTDYGSIGSYESHMAVRDCLRDVKKIVKELAEEYNGGWIPCSERLPEPNQMVLVTEKDSEYVLMCCYERFEGYGYGFCGSNGKVIAWQPLPPVWKGENDGKS